MESTRPSTRASTRAKSTLPGIKLRPKPTRGMRKTAGRNAAPRLVASLSLGSASTASLNDDTAADNANGADETAEASTNIDVFGLNTRSSLTTRLASEESPSALGSGTDHLRPFPMTESGPTTRSAAKRKRTTTIRASTPSEVTPRARRQTRYRTASPSFTPRAPAVTKDNDVMTNDIPGPSSPVRRRIASPTKRRTRSTTTDGTPENTSTTNDLGTESTPRRKTPTPVRYEPPKERLTTPEVVVSNTPPPTTSRSKRKSTRMVLQVKKEPPPDISLSEPVPEPTPGEDPLLLTPRKETLSVIPEEPSHASPTRPADQPRATPLVPPAPSPPALDAQQLSQAPDPPRTPSPAPSTMSHTSLASPPPQPSTLEADLSHWSPPPSSPPRPQAEWPLPGADGGWTPSPTRPSGKQDGDAIGADEGDGEFTGKYWSVMVPTKPDPPTKELAERMEKWGRPVSPFPREPGDRDNAMARDDDSPRMMDAYPQLNGVETRLGRPARLARDEDRSMEDIGDLSFANSINSSMNEGREPIPSTEQDMEVYRRYSSPPEDHYPFSTAEQDREVYERYSATPQPESKRARPRLSDAEMEKLEEEDVVRELSEEPFSDEELDEEEWEETEMQYMHGDFDEDDGDFEEYDEESTEEMDPNLIKITSDDPKAAARAAAILQMYDYDCSSVLPARKHRRSHRTVDELVRSAQRRGASGSGISKSRRTGFKRHNSASSYASDRLFVPGTPEPVHVSEFLREASRELEEEITANKSRTMEPVRASSNPLQTPRQSTSSRMMVPPSTVGWERPEQEQRIVPRAWAKSDWKYLDACFTDQRMEVARSYGLPEGTLADVDLVDMTDVVDRFMQIPEMSALWNRTNVLSRARALQKKQRSGKIAPPTPAIEARATLSPFAAFEVPEFTPAHSRSWSPAGTNSSALPVHQSNDNLKLAPTLLAPRYTHLMEEAIATGHSGSQGDESMDWDHNTDDTMDGSTDGHPASTSRSHGTQVQTAPQQSLGGRMKSYLFSYLRSEPPKPAPKPSSRLATGLPLPLPEMIERTRPPVYTPARPEISRDPHPRELVELHPASPLRSRSPTPNPFEGVSLRHISPPPTPPPAPPIVRLKRGSGASVRDLVKSFEDMEQRAYATAIKEEAMKRMTLRRTKSYGDVRSLGELAAAVAEVGSARKPRRMEDLSMDERANRSWIQ